MKPNWPKLQTLIMGLTIVGMALGTWVSQVTNNAVTNTKIDDLHVLMNVQTGNIQHTVDGVQATVQALMLMLKHSDHASYENPDHH